MSQFAFALLVVVWSWDSDSLKLLHSWNVGVKISMRSQDAGRCIVFFSLQSAMDAPMDERRMGSMVKFGVVVLVWADRNGNCCLHGYRFRYGICC